MAQGDLWKIKATAGGDVVQAKLDLTKNDQAHIRGIPWFGGLAGGASSKPISPIHDISIAGYNVTLNRQPASSGGGPADARMVAAFPTSDSLAVFTTKITLPLYWHSD